MTPPLRNEPKEWKRRGPYITLSKSTPGESSGATEDVSPWGKNFEKREEKKLMIAELKGGSMKKSSRTL